MTAGGAAVPGSVSYAGRTAVFTPTANLAASTNYTATITTAAKDLTGVAMAANFVWTFTSATIGTTSIFKGNVLAAVSITINTGAAVEGRMFAGSTGGAASATVNASTVTVPAP